MSILLAAILAAVLLPPVHEADFVIPQYRFADGETLQNVRIHYATLGTLRRDANGHATNAVLSEPRRHSSLAGASSPRVGAGS